MLKATRLTRRMHFLALFIFLGVSGVFAQNQPTYVQGDTLDSTVLNTPLLACANGDGRGITLGQELSAQNGERRLIWLLFFGSW